MSTPEAPSDRILIHSLDELPSFSNEDEEREWWATHDFAPELWKPVSEADMAKFRQWQERARRLRSTRRGIATTSL